jgi:hypothetical protein
MTVDAAHGAAFTTYTSGMLLNQAIQIVHSFGYRYRQIADVFQPVFRTAEDIVCFRLKNSQSIVTVHG